MSANLKSGLLTLLVLASVTGCDGESSYDVTAAGSTNHSGFDFQTGSLPMPREPNDNPPVKKIPVGTTPVLRQAFIGQSNLCV